MSTAENTKQIEVITGWYLEEGAEKSVVFNQKHPLTAPVNATKGQIYIEGPSCTRQQASHFVSQQFGWDVAEVDVEENYKNRDPRTGQLSGLIWYVKFNLDIHYFNVHGDEITR